ncbi:hypothetical protein GCM10022258_21030 [Aquimarina gracilis]
MAVAESYQVNTPDFERKLLIATQGSDFKDRVTQKIVNHYKSDSIFIEVVDISLLDNVSPKEYSGIVILHTWENWKPPFVVRQFIERTTDQHNKIVVLTTSGEGTYKIKEVDAITGESNTEKAQDFADQVIERLQGISQLNSQ